MGKILERPPAETLYETDTYAWAQDQAAKLRARRYAEVDWVNVVEEIDSVGKQQKQEIENRLVQLLAHLLKARFQPEKWKGGWQATIKVQRLELKKLLRKNPSLKGYPVEVLAEEYEIARAMASAETGLAEETFPAACPFTIDEIMDDGFFG